MNMEVKGTIWKVRNGELLEVKFEDHIFVPKDGSKKEPDAVTKLYTPSEDEQQLFKDIDDAYKKKPVESKELGKLLGYANGNIIFENPLNELKGIVQDDSRRTECLNIIKEYYPNIKSSSREVYLTSYKKWLIEKQDADLKGFYMTRNRMGKTLVSINGVPIKDYIVDDIKEHYRTPAKVTIRKNLPHINEKSLEKYTGMYRKYISDPEKFLKDKNSVSKKQSEKRKAPKKYRRKRPDDAVGYCKVYSSWIKADHVNLIIRSLRKWGFHATAENIAKDSRLSKFIVHKTLRWMIDNNQVYRTNDRKTGDIIYKPESGKVTKVNYP